MQTHIEITALYEPWGKIYLPKDKIGVAEAVRDGTPIVSIFSVDNLHEIAWDIKESYEEVKAMLSSELK